MYPLFAHNLTARSVSRNRSTFGTKDKIESVTRLPFRDRAFFSSMPRRTESSVRSRSPSTFTGFISQCLRPHFITYSISGDLCKCKVDINPADDGFDNWHVCLCHGLNRDSAAFRHQSVTQLTVNSVHSFHSRSIFAKISKKSACVTRLGQTTRVSISEEGPWTPSLSEKDDVIRTTRDREGITTNL